MSKQETRPTEGYFACGTRVAAEIMAALRQKEVDEVAKPLIESAAGVLEGDKENADDV
jgi:hypothetical protein